MNKGIEKRAPIEGMRQAAKHIADYVAFGPYAAPANGEQFENLLKRLDDAEDEQQLKPPSGGL